MRAHTVAAALLASLAVGVPGASAAVRCVAASTGCTSNHATITSAEAVAIDGVDTIRIGPGLFPESITTSKRLVFEGSGTQTANLTQWTAPGAASFALSLTRGGVVRKLALTGPSSSTQGGPALSFAPTTGAFGLLVEDAVIRGGDKTTTASDPVDGAGSAIEVSGTGASPAGLTVRRSALFSGGVRNSNNAGASALSFASPGALEVTDSFASGVVAGQSNVGIAARGGTALVERSVAEGSAGIAGLGPLQLTVRRSTLTGSFRGLILSSTAVGQTLGAQVDDSLLSAAPIGGDPLGAMSIVATGPVSVAATGSTFVTTGPATGAIVLRKAAASPGAAISLRNSLVRHAAPGTGRADVYLDGGQLTAAFSSFSTRTLVNGGTTTAPGTVGNVVADPLIDSAFGLLPGSALIDRGDPALTDRVDRAGRTRSNDGDGDCVPRPDIGAFESAGRAPCPPIAVSGFRVTNKVFAVKKRARSSQRRRKRKVKRGTTFVYRLTEASAVRITIERRLAGRRVGKRCRKPTRRNSGRRRCVRFRRAGTLRASKPAGSRRTAFSGRFRGRALRVGRYRATITATARGKRSRPRRLNLRVVRP